jgi:hypothetical protein
VWAATHVVVAPEQRSTHHRDCFRSFACAFAETEIRARLTALTLSCTAEAYVPRPRGAAAAAHTAEQQRVICSRRDTALVLFGPGGSAAGTKPGRAGFSV